MDLGSKIGFNLNQKNYGDLLLESGSEIFKPNATLGSKFTQPINQCAMIFE